VSRLEGGQYQTHLAGSGENDFAIEAGRGYLLTCDAPSGWYCDGMPLASGAFEVSFSEGLNLIGIPASGNFYDAEGFIRALRDERIDCTSVWFLRDGVWVEHRARSNKYNYDLRPGEAYLVRVTRAGTATLPARPSVRLPGVKRPVRR
jgi:hypothetical protein